MKKNFKLLLTIISRFILLLNKIKVIIIPKELKKNTLLEDKNKDYYYLEFGVFKGTSTNFFSRYVNKFYVFNSFEGLKEDWMGTWRI